MKTQRTGKLIKKLESRHNKINELTEELNRLQIETTDIIGKLKEEQNAAESETYGTRSARGFFSNRQKPKSRGRFVKNIAGFTNSDVIEDGDTVVITNDYKSKKYGSLKGRQGRVQRSSNTFVYLDIPGIPDEIPRGRGNVDLVAKGSQVIGSSSEAASGSSIEESSQASRTSFVTPSFKDHLKY